MKKEKKVYLDANFLVALYYDKHDKNGDSTKKLAKLILNEYRLYVSPLTLNETWFAIYKELKKAKQRELGEEIEIPFNSYYDKYEFVFSDLKSRKEIFFIQLANARDDIEKILKMIKEYNFKPHDAFHIIMAKKKGVGYILTHDSHFNKLSNSPIRLMDF